MDVRYLAAGDTAIVVEFGDTIDRALSERVLALGALVRAAGLPGVIETVPTYRSLLVRYDPLETDSVRLREALDILQDGDAPSGGDARLWRIPASYDLSHAPDLPEVARRTGLSESAVVALHSGTLFHVYMIGFVPGYAYLGDLPPALVLPRRKDPRLRVPAGSIAIATTMTGVYPIESPGGWHLIGATPIRMFDAALPRPALLRPGDKVRFDAVDADEFEAIERALAAGTYAVPYTSLAS